MRAILTSTVASVFVVYGRRDALCATDPLDQRRTADNKDQSWDGGPGGAAVPRSRPTQPPSRPAAPRRPVPYALAQHAQQPVDVRGGPHLFDDRLVLERLGDVCEYL